MMQEMAKNEKRLEDMKVIINSGTEQLKKFVSLLFVYLLDFREQEKNSQLEKQTKTMYENLNSKMKEIQANEKNLNVLRSK